MNVKTLPLTNKVQLLCVFGNKESKKQQNDVNQSYWRYDSVGYTYSSLSRVERLLAVIGLKRQTIRCVNGLHLLKVPTKDFLLKTLHL